MFDYRAVLHYYSLGNTIKQTSVICQCSRTTVYKTIQRAKEIGLEIPVANNITDEQLFLMLYPKRGHSPAYETPDFEGIRRDKVKRRLTLYVAWRRYYKRTIAQGKKAYCKTQFFKLYKRFFKKWIADVKDEVELQYDLLLRRILYYRDNMKKYFRAVMEKDKWLKKMGLNGDRLKIPQRSWLYSDIRIKRIQEMLEDGTWKNL